MIAVDEHHLVADHAVVDGEEEVPSDRDRVLACLPLPALHDDRDRARQQRQPPGVVVVQVREHDPRDSGQVDLLCDAPLQLQLDRAERLGAAVAAHGVRDGVRMQAGVDEDPLVAGVDHVGRDREADRAREVVVATPDAGDRLDPAHVEQLDLHASQTLAPGGGRYATDSIRFATCASASRCCPDASTPA